MIIAMAGLPGTGKSSLAAALATNLPAIVLNKDIVRAALFLPEEIEYSQRQDDLVVNILLQVAEFYFQKNPDRFIIIDGRTFSKKNQVDALVDYSFHHNRELRVILCTCSDKVARDRIERDLVLKEHLASDRDFNLYLRLQAQSDPLQVQHLRVDTGDAFEYCVQLCLDYLSNPISSM